MPRWLKTFGYIGNGLLLLLTFSLSLRTSAGDSRIIWMILFAVIVLNLEILHRYSALLKKLPHDQSGPRIRSERG